jgi:transcriptional regulator with GAF, ATPase, and Fis domain
MDMSNNESLNHEILSKVEEQKKERELSGKIFRYSALILAVDYFSQKLNPEQILNAAFDFVNELMTLESSSLYALKDGSFQLTREKGISIGVKSIPCSKKLNDLAVLHGNVLTGRSSILRFFDEYIYDNCNVEIVIPIIVDTTLEGFLLIPEKASGEFDENDRSICEVLMNLCNSAMRNYATYNELRSINTSLDEKIFNLFAINQSSKALLSQLDLDALYSLSIDVFSELTQSSSTGFVLYDEKSEKYVLRSCRFVFESSRKLDLSLEMNEGASVDPNRIIIDLADPGDQQYFDSIFKNGVSEISVLSAQYVILLNKGSHVLGFVTLGATVTGTGYKKNIFELIESLASSTYIAISNAKHFKQVEEQKKIIQNKLDRLISLNRLVKNINNSMNIETLIDITMKTLSISFLAEKCLMATYDSNEKAFMVRSSFGLNAEVASIKTNKHWNRVMKGRTALVMETSELKEYFDDTLEKLTDITGALIAPIYLDRADVEILGVIIVFGFFDSLISDEENVLTIETISGHIAPLLHNLALLEEQKHILRPDYSELFKRDLANEIRQAGEYGLELFVIKAGHTGEFSFSNPDLGGILGKKFEKVYTVAYNTVYIITNSREDADRDSILKELDIQGSFVHISALGRDFSTLEEYLAI